MINSNDALTEVAEAILEHAQSITRLDRNTGAGAYESAYGAHVRAMRLLAVPHMDPQPDRGLVRSLRTLAADFAGVYVQMTDGAIQLVIDTASTQHKVKLWNRRQLLKGEEED